MNSDEQGGFPTPPRPRVGSSNAPASHYRLLQKRIGTTRVVIVQPRNYAIDNRVTVDAIAQLGPNARGVAVLHPTVTDAELKALHAAGVRGGRLTLGGPGTAVVEVDTIRPRANMPDNNKPNDALLFDLLTEWAPDEATRTVILVRNPEALYGFAKSA